MSGVRAAGDSGGVNRPPVRAMGGAFRRRDGVSRAADTAETCSREAAPAGMLSRRFAVLGLFLRGLLLRARACAAVLLPLALSGCVFFDPGEESAVGIIGGADGPTSIFLTFNSDPRASVALLVVLGIIVVVAAAILIRRGRKNKK